MSRRFASGKPLVPRHHERVHSHRFGAGDRLEEAIGCVAELAANYIAARQ